MTKAAPNVWPYPHRTIEQADYDEWARRPRAQYRMTREQWHKTYTHTPRVLKGWWPKACETAKIVK